MTLITEVRKSVTDAAPVYAVVGATDLAVEKVRHARARAAGLDVTTLQDKAAAGASKVAEQAQQVPALALHRTLELAGKAQSSYDDLVARGEHLVKRLRDQRATQDLLASAESTVARGKGAVTTARKAAVGTQRSAKATLTTGRHQAGTVADTVADALADDAKTVAEQVKASSAATRTSARRTATTARKAAARSSSAGKAAVTSARKTGKGTTKAAAKAAEKVGD